MPAPCVGSSLTRAGSQGIGTVVRVITTLGTSGNIGIDSTSVFTPAVGPDVHIGPNAVVAGGEALATVFSTTPSTVPPPVVTVNITPTIGTAVPYASTTEKTGRPRSPPATTGSLGSVTRISAGAPTSALTFICNDCRPDPDAITPPVP